MDNYTYLSELIDAALLPLIGKQCVVYDAPYHENIGDVLIFEGEMDFLRKHEIECVGVASYNTCSFPQMSTDTTILFHGGGNIGDLYHEHMNFLINLIQHYPSNRIIVFPQTIFYKDKVLCQNDFKILSKHRDLIICVRDNESFSIVNKAFTGKVLLLPDMAFCISISSLKKYLYTCKKEKLYIKRIDEEAVNKDIDLSESYDISDWPCVQRRYMFSTIGNKIFENLYKLLGTNILLRVLWDKYFIHIHRFMLIKEGVKFISQYKTIYTQRLHGAILAVLLEKNVKILDNSYGKNSSFYNTWLKDLNNVELVDLINGGDL